MSRKEKREIIVERKEYVSFLKSGDSVYVLLAEVIIPYYINGPG